MPHACSWVMWPSLWIFTEFSVLVYKYFIGLRSLFSLRRYLQNDTDFLKLLISMYFAHFHSFWKKLANLFPLIWCIFENKSSMDLKRYKDIQKDGAVVYSLIFASINIMRDLSFEWSNNCLSLKMLNISSRKNLNAAIKLLEMVWKISNIVFSCDFIH